MFPARLQGYGGEQLNVFGHVGLTVGVTFSAEQIVRAGLLRLRPALATNAAAKAQAPGERRRGGAAESLDYRIVMVASLAPDFLDKPLGLWLAPDLVNHGTRTLGHTTALAVLLLAVAWAVLSVSGSSRWLTACASSAGHLVLDRIWTEPVTAVWPLLGWAFPEASTTFSTWSSSHVRDLSTLYTDPVEVAGAVVLMLLAVRVLRRKGALRFLRSGAAS